MRDLDKTMTRRRFAGLALGSAAIAAGGRVLAQTTLTPTADATSGPFFPATLPADSDADLTRVAGRAGRAAGRVIEVRGRVLDRHGNPMPRTRVELWQANAAGRYDHPDEQSEQPLDPDFQSYADLVTDADGGWRIVTVKPGAYDSPIGRRTPHIHYKVDGPNKELFTQMYFSDEADANAVDGLYRELGELAPTAVANADAAQPDVYNWDIVLGG